MSLPVRKKAEKQKLCSSCWSGYFRQKVQACTYSQIFYTLSVLANLSRTLYVGARDTLVTFADDVQPPLGHLNVILKKYPDNQVNGRTYWLFVWKMSNA